MVYPLYWPNFFIPAGWFKAYGLHARVQTRAPPHIHAQAYPAVSVRGLKNQHVFFAVPPPALWPSYGHGKICKGSGGWLGR